MENVSEKGLLSLIALTFIPGIGPRTARKMLSFVIKPEEIFQIPSVEYLHQKIVNQQVAQHLKNPEYLKKAEYELNYAQKHRIEIIHLFDTSYPYRLSQCDDAPLILYKKGVASLNPLRAVSIVGTRRATAYGKQCVDELVHGMKGDNLQIISGLAIGIDSFAHRAALQNDLQTIAILGTGLNVIYPAINKNLAEKIMQQGALVSEFSVQEPSEKSNFPRRNRIIAGMSDAVIVAETGIRGGALITAQLANSYNRDVFAFPGRVNDELSEGCNWLIKTNRAALITSVNDFYELMNWEKPGQTSKLKQQYLPISVEEENILKLLFEYKECGIDFICERLDMSISKASTILFHLEMSGLVRCLPGKRYIRI